ncbi:hypothetical protein XELAEV_18031500mg [Xenopus laevis]|uniref:Uncharacterized protein n=1 Tax=Xenopus laevis TaxID=8355 RepID=A0A974CMU8_XENLA|nr:hypothetical protein XELAEV_18031500mg [Xenopus laevis]
MLLSLQAFELAQITEENYHCYTSPSPTIWGKATQRKSFCHQVITAPKSHKMVLVGHRAFHSVMTFLNS